MNSYNHCFSHLKVYIRGSGGIADFSRVCSIQLFLSDAFFLNAKSMEISVFYMVIFKTLNVVKIEVCILLWP
jgi:hypothetical protein